MKWLLNKLDWLYTWDMDDLFMAFVVLYLGFHIIAVVLIKTGVIGL